MQIQEGSYKDDLLKRDVISVSMFIWGLGLISSPYMGGRQNAMYANYDGSAM